MAYGTARPPAYIRTVERAAPSSNGESTKRQSAAPVAESMQDVFDIYTIIFLALAVFIFLRLRSVLGQRTGRERPPYDPYAGREPVRPATENVVALPALFTPHPGAKAQVAECRQNIDASVDAFAIGIPKSKQFERGARKNLDKVVVQPKALAKGAHQVGGPSREWSHGLAHGFARADAPAAQVEIGCPLRIGRGHGFAAAMVAARTWLGRGQSAHGQDLGVDTGVLPRADRFGAAEARRKCQGCIHADNGVFGSAQQLGNQRGVVERCFLGSWKELSDRYAITGSFEHGEGGLLALATSQVQPDEAGEAIVHVSHRHDCWSFDFSRSFTLSHGFQPVNANPGSPPRDAEGIDSTALSDRIGEDRLPGPGNRPGRRVQ